MLFRTDRVDDHGPPVLEGVVGEAAFARVLGRERDRADRTHDVFSLVTLPVAEAQRLDAGWCRRLARLLRTRLRSTDEVGWLPGSKLGIALPHTPVEGAWTLVEDLRVRLERYTLRHSPLRFDVYAHTGYGGNPGGRLGRDLVPVPHAKGGVLSGRAMALDTLLLQPPGKLKRAVDVVLGTVALIATTPLVAVSALVIRCTSRGPVLFRQQRAGYGGRPFTLYKLRTMVEGADEIKSSLAGLNEADGPIFKIENDPRLTAVGRFLRRTSIDELPQLWNVLRGDMSLVGPRPPTLDEVADYASWQRRRLHALGGLTCFWQVMGRSDIGFLDWMRLDVRYLRQRGLLTDLLLLLRTIPAVIAGRGAR
jgi:lipopolysaccharide/colanic/teichoic acid biosynthesis glycosyltransferase